MEYAVIILVEQYQEMVNVIGVVREVEIFV
jgi:hypothetical protein